MIRRPPRSTLHNTLFPYTTLFRSQSAPMPVVACKKTPSTNHWWIRPTASRRRRCNRALACIGHGPVDPSPSASPVTGTGFHRIEGVPASEQAVTGPRRRSDRGSHRGSGPGIARSADRVASNLRHRPLRRSKNPGRSGSRPSLPRHGRRRRSKRRPRGR